MATTKRTVNKKDNEPKLSPYEQQLVDDLKKVAEYQRAAEVNVVSTLYKHPMEFLNHDLTLENFRNNTWRVLFEIGKELVKTEHKEVIDELVVGLYLEKHDKLREVYEESGGWGLIDKSKEYMKIENLDSYIKELHKWNIIYKLMSKRILNGDRLSDYADMSEQDIYDELNLIINHTFVNTTDNVKSYNIMEGIPELIEELDKGEDLGLPLWGADILSKEIGGFHTGSVYMLGLHSGGGKSALSFLYLFPSILETKERILFMINEESHTRFQIELLVYVINNVLKKDITKYIVRNGNYTPEIRDVLDEATKWIEERKNDHTITVIPLESYNVNTVVKLIRKYHALGVKYFVNDTLKLSGDSYGERSHEALMKDVNLLYDLVKPANLNVGLWLTMQLTKNSINNYSLTTNDIGMSKNIVDVASVVILARKPHQSEFKGGANQLDCYRIEGKASKIPFTLDPEKKYLIHFLAKSRYSATNEHQYVSEIDLGRGKVKMIGYCFTKEDMR